MTDEIKKILQSQGEMLASHGEQLDLIATKVVEHDERLERMEEKMATREDISRMTNTLDRLVNLAEKKDQELTIVAHDMRKFSDRLEKVDSDLRKLKPALGTS